MIERFLRPEIEVAMGDTPVTMVTGPRQSGKSTLVQSLLANRDDVDYLTLDRAVSLGAALDDPAGFIADSARMLVIDEVQRAPDLLREIKASVDADRRPGRFVLTGSADVLTLPRVAETLAGRVEVLRLWPMSQGEIEGRRESFLDALFAGEPGDLHGAALSRPDLRARIEAGGFPEAVARSGARREHWFESYLETALQREVSDIADVAGLSDLPRLMMALAARATGLLNLSDVARNLDLPRTTLGRYVALLEAALLIQTVPAWFRNIGKRLVKSPKLILTDTGLLAHLLGGGAGLERAFGAALENFVLMEIVKQAGVHPDRPGVFHYRTAEGAEVDAVIERRGAPICAVEVKAAATLSARDTRGLKGLAESLGDEFGVGVILHGGGEKVRIGPKIWALPIAALWAGA